MAPTPSHQRRPALGPLQEAASRLAEYARFQGRYRTRELVGLLTSQAERTARIAKPTVNIHLYIAMSDPKRRPVNIRLR